MSLSCRVFRKKGEDQIYYYCRNTGVRPTETNFWTDPTEIPKEIEHYFKTAKLWLLGLIWQLFSGFEKNYIRIFQNVIIQNLRIQTASRNVVRLHLMAIGRNAHIFQRKSERNSNS